MVNKKFVTLAIAVISALSFSAQASLIVNGSFEQIDPAKCSVQGLNTSQSSCDPTTIATGGGSNGGWGIFDSLPGWNLLYGNGVEVQGKNAISFAPNDGLYYVELDSAFFWKADGSVKPENSNSGIYQSISGLSVGQRFTLNFAYSPRTNVKDDNGLHVFWGNDVNTLKDSSIDSLMLQGTKEWRLATYTLMATDSTMFLGFGAYGDNSRKLNNQTFTVNGDGLGMLLDNVSLTAIPSQAVPAPATLALFGLGLMGLAYRRRK